MDILSLLPMLLKILPFAAIGVLYALWRRAAYVRDKAKEERDGYKASYEVAGKVAEIEKEKDADVARIENLDLAGVVNELRGLYNPRSKS